MHVQLFEIVYAKATPSYTLVSGHLPAWKPENSIYEDYY